MFFLTATQDGLEETEQLQPSLDVTLPGSLDAAAHGQALFGAGLMDPAIISTISWGFIYHTGRFLYPLSPGSFAGGSWLHLLPEPCSAFPPLTDHSPFFVPGGQLCSLHNNR